MSRSCSRFLVFRRVRGSAVLVGLSCLVLAATIGQAQYIGSTMNSLAMLPDAPSSSLALEQSPQAVIGTASIAGIVVDQSGAAVEGATVNLIDATGRSVQKSMSGRHGEYGFESLSAGTFRVIIKAAGFATFVTEMISLNDQQLFTVPNTSLSIAFSNTEVTVRANDKEVADAQIRAAERQRVLGFVPNFYTSYQLNAVPLNTKQKYSLALRDTFDPVRFVGTGLGAGIEQANNNFKGYGQGAAGYGKRYAALYGNGLFSDILSHAVFPAIFHQDPRYFYQGTGMLKSRFLHAVSFALVIRGDRGNIEPNYFYLLGDLTAGAISNAYYPHADRGPGLVFTNTAIGIASRAAVSLAREFILPRLTTNKAGADKP